VSPTLASVPSWPEPVERVASFLRRSGAEARIEEFAVETPTAADAARAAGCNLAQIVKTVVFDCGDRFVVALTPGDRRADAEKVARAANAARAKVAKAAQVVEATGFEPGAVAPFPLPGVAAAFVDQTLLVHDKVWVGAGSTSHLATLAPAELVRLTDAQPHDFLKRLENSARLLYMDLPYTTDELRAACFELIGVNGLPECYLRPIAFYGYGELGVAATGNPIDVAIMSWPWGAYLGEEGLKTGIRAKISSWQRVGPNVIPHASKASGVYVNSMLAVTEANRAGYDEAILLTTDGFIADGSGENVFVVRDGRIFTPDLSPSILPGITRDTV